MARCTRPSTFFRRAVDLGEWLLENGHALVYRCAPVSWALACRAAARCTHRPCWRTRTRLAALPQRAACRGRQYAGGHLRHYVSLEAAARAAGRGVWAGGFVPPWEWRKDSGWP